MGGLSVVIPSYNSARWLKSTLEALGRSISHTQWETEVIVVNDGSSDDSLLILDEIKPSLGLNLKIISQENQGRFLARWSGIKDASKSHILLLDSRVIIEDHSLSYVEAQINASVEQVIWNAYVRTDEGASLPGLFWDVPTRLFWGDFLQNPRQIRFGQENFDRYPKGTGCLLVTRDSLIDSYKEVWPDGDFALVSDDTRLLRNLIQKHDIVLDPDFSALYRPRISLKSFASHTFMRGTLFVDSYAGTSIFRKLIIVLAALFPFAFIAASYMGYLMFSIFTVILILLIPAFIGAYRKASVKSLAAYLSLVIPFGILFWAGLVRGIFVHRHHFKFRMRPTK